MALYWHSLRRRVRARNLLLRASSDLPFAYEIWISRNERLDEIRREAPVIIDQWAFRPKFGVLLRGDGGRKGAMDRTIRSLDCQIYPYWSLIEDQHGSLGAQIDAADCDYVIPLRVCDVLAEAALFRLAEAMQTKPAQLIYGDEDQLGEDGRRTQPWFKPRWNRELFLAQDYLHYAVAISAPLARAVQAESSLVSVPELVLRAATRAEEGAIHHVAHIVCHVSARPGNDYEERQQPLETYLASLNARGMKGALNTNWIQWPLPSQHPLVSIIVPTKDKLDLLVPCVETVLNRTDYSNFELLVIDNLSTEPDTAEYLAKIAKDSRVRVLEYARPYNFSAINNYAVSQAQGDFVCLLNNDTEVLEPAWLSEMMRYAARPDIGAVGAKLLYEDGSIQHAGVVIGIGDAAGHAHRFEPNDSPGYFAMPHVAHFVSAVTAACLVVAKSKFEAVGGLDEESFAIAFNDVDLCLKLQAAGWKNVYVPHAVLIHHESKSRGNDMAPSQIERYRKELRMLQERWNTTTYDDPLHNPNLDRYSEKYVIRL